MWNTGMLSLNRKWPFIRSHVFFVPRSGRYTDTCLNSTHMESTQSLFRISWDQHVPLRHSRPTPCRLCDLSDGIPLECVSVFANSSGTVTAVWSWQDTVSWSGSNHLHYKLFQPPSSSSTILITPRTATCRSLLRGPAPSGASASAPTPQAWSVFPPDTPPAVREHWPCTLEANLQDPEAKPR